MINRLKLFMERYFWGYFRLLRKKWFERYIIEIIEKNFSTSNSNITVFEKLSTRYWKIDFDKIEKSDILDMLDFSKKKFKIFPKFSIIVSCYKTNINHLKEMLLSLEKQVYENYEICIVDDFSCNQEIKNILLEFLDRNNKEKIKVKLKFLEQNLGISLAINEAVKMADGEYIVLVDHDDILPVQALWTFAYYININSDKEIELLYSDEDKIDENGIRYDPYFKSDFSYTFFLQQNFVAHCGVYKRETVNKIKGFRKGFDGSQDYDFTLRFIKEIECDRKKIIHVPYILYHWRRYEKYDSFSSKYANKSLDSHLRALQDFVGENKLVIKNEIFDRYDIINKKNVDTPLISVVCCFKDKAILLKNIINMLLNKTEYENIEIILVDNGSSENRTFSYLDSIKNIRNIKTIRDDKEFNYSRLNNLGARYANGDFILFLNNDVDIFDDNLWLRKMVDKMIDEKDIGICGIKLLFENKKIQHAGVAIGMGNCACNIYYNQDDKKGYYRWDISDRDVSALTGAVMLVRKSLFEKVKGFDEELFPINFNDVDLSLKILNLGYRNIVLNSTSLLHYESLSRKNTEGQNEFYKSSNNIIKKYGNLLYNDVFFNPNLSLTSSKVEIAEFPRTYKLWRDFIEFVCPFHLGDVLISLSVCYTIAKKYNKKIRFWTSKKIYDLIISDIKIDTQELQIFYIDDFENISSNVEKIDSLKLLKKYIMKVAERDDSSQNIRTLHGDITEIYPNGVHIVDYCFSKFPIKNMDNKIFNLKIEKRDYNFKNLSKSVLIHIRGGWELKHLDNDYILKIKDICEKKGLNLVQVGSKSEERHYLINDFIMDDLSISNWKYIFKEAKCFIGVDSFFSHLSAICNINRVIFYGSTKGEFLDIKNYLYDQSGRSLIFDSICEESPCKSFECKKNNKLKTCDGYNLDEKKLSDFLDSLI